MPTPVLFGTGDGILQMLKTYYAKEGLSNLLYRNSPLLKKIRKERVEGKTANFSTLYSRGGAVSANFLMAKSLAKNTARAMEFQVSPGKIYSCCSFTVPELQASKTARGAYLPIAKAKLFASEESMRKTLAMALYGDGYGYLCAMPATLSDGTTATAIVSGSTAEVILPSHVVMVLDIGSSLAIKATKATPESTSGIVSKYEVTKIDGQKVTIKNNTDTDYSYTSGDVVCLAGCVDASGNPLLPVGLAGWLPSSVAASDSFFGVNRSVARDRLAGAKIVRDSGNSEPYYKTIERAIMELRRAGSLADIIVVSDADFVTIAGEIENKTYLTKPNGGEKRSKASMGVEQVGFSMSTSWVDDVIDDPYLEKGVCYILDSSSVEFWIFTNVDKITQDGVIDNNPGKPDINMQEETQANRPYQLLVDDVFSVTNGEDTYEGPASLISTTMIGSFVVTNPSVNARVEF